MYLKLLIANDHLSLDLPIIISRVQADEYITTYFGFRQMALF